MIAFDAPSFSERMGNGGRSLCRVGEPVKGFTRSNKSAKGRKEKRRKNKHEKTNYQPASGTGHAALSHAESGGSRPRLLG